MESVVFQGSQCPTYSMGAMLIWNRHREFGGSVRLKAASFCNMLMLQSFCISLNCHAWCTHQNRELLGHPQCSVWKSSKEQMTQSAHLCSAHGQAPLFLLTKHKFKDKTILDFNTAGRALSQALGPSECGAQWDAWVEDPRAGPEFPGALFLLPRSCYSSVQTLLYCPLPSFASGSHRHRALPPITCLMLTPGPWTSLCIFSPSKSTFHHQPLSFSRPSSSWILILPISTAAIWFSLQPLQPLQPLQQLPSGFPCSHCSLLMDPPESSQSELSKNTVWSSSFIQKSFNGPRLLKIKAYSDRG